MKRVEGKEIHQEPSNFTLYKTMGVDVEAPIRPQNDLSILIGTIHLQKSWASAGAPICEFDTGLDCYFAIGKVKHVWYSSLATNAIKRCGFRAHHVWVARSLLMYCRV